MRPNAGSAKNLVTISRIIPISSLRPGLVDRAIAESGERLHADMARRTIAIADSIASFAQH
jgi:hypothetical protein